ncbi:MFS transporter [Sphingomonas lacunae]|uniref:MFS transporter n=1 Tax=Sphingomonas lacunae TaxID=2698828 RepID=A0A6M4AU25_9SPHN|nr:MFS transporter [Sphingomonas lacunae]QJQ32607.1 MFS transporter [Sphingomonas lacunae]
MTDAQRRFALAYVCANVGAFLCFVPLISLMLPRRMAELDPAASLVSTSWALLAGAVAASLANIVGGAVSDRVMVRYGTRMPMIAFGLVATFAAFPALARATTAADLVLAFMLFQVCFNLMFAPLGALATDYVADEDKGRMFGLLNLALPMGQGAIFLVALSGVTSLGPILLVIALVATLCLLPLLLQTHIWRCPQPDPEARLNFGQIDLPCARTVSWDFARAWMARLLVQCASVAVGSYLFLLLAGLPETSRSEGLASQWFGQLSLLGAVLSVIAGWSIGYLSDRIGRRRPFLWLSALAVAGGCAVIAGAEGRLQLDLGFALFSVGLAAFLTIDGALVAQLVGNSPNRAFLLGILNLTNTLSGVIIPAMTIAMGQATGAASGWLFAAAAAGALLAALLALMIRTID